MRLGTRINAAAAAAVFLLSSIITPAHSAATLDDDAHQLSDNIEETESLNLKLSTSLWLPSEPPTVRCAIGLSCVMASLAGRGIEPVNLVRNVVDTWQVPLPRASGIVSMAIEQANIHGIDPLLILGVIAQESSFTNQGNPSSDGAKINPSKPHGLMQVSGKWHPDLFQKKNGKLVPNLGVDSIAAGSAVLGRYIRKFRGDVVAALQAYNGNLSDQTLRYTIGVFDKAMQIAR